MVLAEVMHREAMAVLGRYTMDKVECRAGTPELREVVAVGHRVEKVVEINHLMLKMPLVMGDLPLVVVADA